MSYSTITLTVINPAAGNSVTTANSFTVTITSSSYPDAVSFTNAAFKGDGLWTDQGFFIPKSAILALKVS